MRMLPSGRSLALGAALLMISLGSYAAARETSLFAIDAIEVTGAPPGVAKDVRSALAPLEGRSLVAVSPDDVAARVEALPWVAAVDYDRAFPHGLRVQVTPERPLAVLRRGSNSWLVSASGRVLEEVGARAHPRLPRVWLAKTATPRVGRAAGADAHAAVVALAPAVGTPFLGRVRFVRQGEETLTLVLRSGLEVRLGDASQVRLKLAVARRLLPFVMPPGYVDLSVPERPVASTNPQVEGRG